MLMININVHKQVSILTQFHIWQVVKDINTFVWCTPTRYWYVVEPMATHARTQDQQLNIAGQGDTHQNKG